MNPATTILQGDVIDRLNELSDGSVDAVVTDPPYGIQFMGKSWDSLKGRAFQEWCKEWARECLRVLKPGGHLLSFGGSRTYHRLACAVEDAGFEIRDQIMWLHGQGFPKSMNVAKAIDKAGADAAREWDGWGTALKPAHEPIVVARKPLIGTVAANVQTHGTGAINVDACRVASESSEGRWPANVIHDGSAEVLGAFPAGDPSRFFYCAKAGRKERDAGLDHLPRKFLATMGDGIGVREHNPDEPSAHVRNNHPTVKPVALMRYLVRLVTRTGGLVLDPFVGSGTTAVACVAEGFDFVGIELEAEYVAIAEARIDHARSS